VDAHEDGSAIAEMVAVRLDEAARKWLQKRDRRGLRRSLLDLLHVLDE
jgi:hypothetical protein